MRDDELHPLLDVDDAGQVVLGVVGEQRPLPGASGDVVDAPTAAADPSTPDVPGQLDLDELPDPEASWALRGTTR